MAKGRLFDEDFLRRLQRLGLLAKRLSTGGGSAGRHRSRRLGDGLEFADHRAYSPGDDIRFLDWPYYARMERLLLRLFHEHSEGVVTILLDASGSMALGDVCKFDYARRTAAALAYVAMVGLDRVRLLPFAESLGEGISTGRNRRQILRVLDFLEGLRAGGATDLAGAVELLVRRGGQSGTVILVTDAIDTEDGLAGALGLLKQHGDQVILVHVADRSDSAPELLGPAQLQAVETGRTLAVNATDAVLLSYRRRWGEFVRDIEKTSLARGTLYVQAPTSAPFERLVLETLRRSGVLQP